MKEKQDTFQGDNRVRNFLIEEIDIKKKKGINVSTISY